MRYIFDSGTLKDLVGASDLIADVAQSGDDADDLVGRVTTALGLGSTIQFSRRAGAVFCAHADEAAPLDRLRAALRLAVGLRCPGLEFSDSGPFEGETDGDARRRVYENASALRFNSAAELPPSGHGFTAFAQRSGRVATRLFAYGDAEQDVFRSDVVSAAHRMRAEDIANGMDRVSQRFIGDAKPQQGSAFKFPRNLDSEEEAAEEQRSPTFPYLGSDRRIAVIHADISGLGEAFQGMAPSLKSVDDAWRVAAGIERSVIEAAQAAVKEVLIPRASEGVLPARPILLGGDDITIIVRADLALPFARRLLIGIELETERHFTSLRATIAEAPARLSACAGIAIVAKGSPFLVANSLADSLCAYAKKRVKAGLTKGPYASALAFHVAQSPSHESFEDDVLTREMLAEDTRMTGNPYVVGSTKPTARTFELSALEELAGALARAPQGRGKLFEAAASRFTDAYVSRLAFHRWRQVLQQADKSGMNRIREALRPFESESAAGTKTDHDEWIGPICDALEWNDVVHAYEPADPAASEQGGVR